MDASFHVRPFAFDRVFTVVAEAGEQPSTGDLRMQVAGLEFEVEQLRRAHAAELAQARQDGFEAGLASARAERDTALLSAVDALQAGLETVDQEVDEVARRMQADAAQVALAAAELIAARALEADPSGAIDAAIGRVLRQVARGTELVVHVHPSLAGEVERVIAVRQAGDRRRLHLQVAADESVTRGDARIEWDQGGLVLDAAGRAQAVRAELAALLAPAATA
jgi:flagellar assembly protein FliH